MKTYIILLYLVFVIAGLACIILPTQFKDAYDCWICDGSFFVDAQHELDGQSNFWWGCDYWDEKFHEPQWHCSYLYYSSQLLGIILLFYVFVQIVQIEIKHE